MAIATIGLHVADVAFLQPEPGVSARDHLVSGLVPIGLLAALAAVYPRMRAGLRATLAIFVGLFVLVSGIATSVSHAISEGASGTDYTGILAAGAGATLIAVGAVTLWSSRKLDRKAWRYSRRALIAIAGLVIAVQLVGGAALGYYATHRPESSVGEPDLGRPHEDVTLTTSDGLQLEGWYVPSRNRAAVLVFPGRSGNKQHHARNLIGHGYGVLLIDNRGQGASEGDPNVFGWDDETDVNAALDFLYEPGRRGRRTGLEGSASPSEARRCSRQPRTRTECARSCPRGPARGPGRRTTSCPDSSVGICLPFFVTSSASTALFANTLPPESLKELVKDIAPRPVFLIHAKGETLNPVYYRSAGEPENWEIWEVPGAKHVGGLEARPREYEQRVTAFFDRALLTGRSDQ